MLCYKISDPTTLFSALNHWYQEIRDEAPAAPIVLVGCGSDLRNDRDVLAALAKVGRAPVSVDQALSFTQQIGGVMYVETSSKTSARAAVSAFEVAGLASLGLLAPQQVASSASQSSVGTSSVSTIKSNGSDGGSGVTPRSTPSPRSINKKQRFSSCTTTPSDSLERKDTLSGIVDPAAPGLERHHRFWETLRQQEGPDPATGAEEAVIPKVAGSPPRAAPEPPRVGGMMTRSVSTPRNPASGAGGHARSASLSCTTKARSINSIPSTTLSLGSKTPKSTRKSAKPEEATVTIKCQRLTADKNYEEIEVEVPVPIYETIQMYNDTSSLNARNKERRRSFGSKLKNLFINSPNTNKN